MFEYGAQIIVAGSVVGLVGLYLVGITFYLSKILQFPPHYMHRTPTQGLAKKGSIVDPIWGDHINDPKMDFGLDFKEVVFPSAMNQPAPIPLLRGWYIPCKTRITKNRIGFITVHGGGRDRREFHRFETFLNGAGYEMLLFDYRDHGVSDGPGHGMDWGRESFHDILGAAYFAKHCLQWEKVICLGVSNGAVLSLLAAANDDGSLIDGIIAESPFLSLNEGVKDIIDLTMEQYPRWLAYAAMTPLVSRLVSTALTFRIGGIKDIRSCNKIVDKISPRPILLIHGTSDNRFRTRHSQLLYRLISQEAKEIWLIPGGRHTEGYDRSPLEYEKKVLAFANKYFQSKMEPRA